MKKVMRKSKRKKDLRKRERRGRGIVAKTIRFLDRWHTWAQTDKHKHGEGVAILQFIAAHQAPYKTRGDEYLQTLMNIVNETTELVTEPGGRLEWAALPAKIKALAEDLRELRTDRLNYDDMRAALEKLHMTPWPLFGWGKRKLLESSGASNALIGAPVSDAGAMRNALRLIDSTLTLLVQSIDTEKPKPLQPDTILDVWTAIHAARKAMTAVERVGPGSGYETPPTVFVVSEDKTPKELALFFHETYERLAPSFGYETRKDTKAFDPESPNGKLMTAVCEEVRREMMGGATATLQVAEGTKSFQMP